MYPYRAYIETLLSYGPAAKESPLTGVMWYKDTPGQQDKRTTDNKGFTARNKVGTLLLSWHTRPIIKSRLRKWLCMCERYN